MDTSTGSTAGAADIDPGLHVHSATDILLDPVRAALPRSRAYVKARSRFWTAFPHGKYQRLPTPGTDLECAFYALRLSLAYQYPQDPTLPVPVPVPIPTIPGLRSEFSSLSSANAAAGLSNTCNFSADQLAAVFSSWGASRGLRCQLGYVSGDDGVPVLINSASVTVDDDDGEPGGEGGRVVRVWVYNDGMALRGLMGHFEGIKRPS